MNTNVTKSYLDLARAVIKTKIDSNEGESIDDAIFALMSCTYVYSYSALLSFCSSQLHALWVSENSDLRDKYKDIKSFERLMATSLKDVKSAIKELVLQKGLKPIHDVEPKLWQNLNEFVKHYRDFFLHPNPDLFEEYVGKAGNAQWQLASSTACGILCYVYAGCNGSVPNWVFESGLVSHGFSVKSV
jgi:hypothetical protein